MVLNGGEKLGIHYYKGRTLESYQGRVLRNFLLEKQREKEK